VEIFEVYFGGKSGSKAVENLLTTACLLPVQEFYVQHC